MGEVVDMTGRIVVADQHPLGAESVRDVSVERPRASCVQRGTRHLM